jgi:putative oxidoreductase
MTILFFIGRLIFGGYWLINAYNHLFKTSNYLGYVQSKGIKYPRFSIIGSGILILIGGLSMIFGFWPKIGAIAIAIFLIGVTYKMHAFWKIVDPMQKMNEQIQFRKNIALLGASIMTLAIATPWMWSI